MQKPTLQFGLDGALQEGGQVLFGDLQAFMKNLLECLTVVERRIAGSTGLQHVIADMSKSSAHMTLAPSGRRDMGKIVYDKFKETVTRMERGGEVDPRFNTEDLKKFRSLARLALSGKKGVQIAGVQLSAQYVANIDRLLGRTVKSLGTVKGCLEKLNVHNKNEFTLFTPIGDYAVTCGFNDDLFEQVQQAIKKTVTVYGKLFYSRSDRPYPERVHVNAIEIHPSDEDSPKLMELGGLMPEATNGKTALQFIEDLRND